MLSGSKLASWHPSSRMEASIAAVVPTEHLPSNRLSACDMIMLSESWQRTLLETAAAPRQHTSGGAWSFLGWPPQKCSSTPKVASHKSLAAAEVLLSPPQVKTAQFLGRLLAEHGHRAALLHGKRPQAEREVGDLLYSVHCRIPTLPYCRKQPQAGGKVCSLLYFVTPQKPCDIVLTPFWHKRPQADCEAALQYHVERVQTLWAQRQTCLCDRARWAATEASVHQVTVFQGSTCLHGRLQEAMRDFRSGKVTTLVATDVAGRGLHISRWALSFRSRRHSMRLACAGAPCRRLEALLKKPCRSAARH